MNISEGKVSTPVQRSIRIKVSGSIDICVGSN